MRFLTKFVLALVLPAFVPAGPFPPLVAVKYTGSESEASPTAVASAASTADAVKEPYAKVGRNWFIYEEELSCVMYFDQAGRPILRFSKRDDVNRLYVNIVSDKWTSLREHVGRPVTYFLQFSGTDSGYGSAAQVIDNGDGSYGFGGGENLSMNGVLNAVATSSTMVIFVADANPPTPKGLVGVGIPMMFSYENGAEAVQALRRCSDQLEI